MKQETSYCSYSVLLKCTFCRVEYVKIKKSSLLRLYVVVHSSELKEKGHIVHMRLTQESHPVTTN